MILNDNGFNEKDVTNTLEETKEDTFSLAER